MALRPGVGTLSMSTSLIWLKPTMQTFMSRAGTMACTRPHAVAAVTSEIPLIASRETETTLSCGNGVETDAANFSVGGAGRVLFASLLRAEFSRGQISGRKQRGAMLRVI